MKAVLVALFLMNLSAMPAKADVDACSSILSGESPELTAAIRDLSKLRYELDVAMAQGESNVMRRAMQDAYEKKEAEIIRSAKIDQETLVARIRTEIESIQKKANTEEARRNEVKAEEQKEIQKVKKAKMLLMTGTFVKIPAGTFMMGDDVKHEVTLTQDYEMQTTLVTQGQYLAAMDENPSQFQDKEHCPDTWVDGVGCPKNPVEYVNWNDVQDFIRILNTEDDGYLYRLPTEAEWEYAARAGTTTPYYWGGDSMDGDYAWYGANSDRHTHEVAQKKPNAYGLYDMTGNLWEWVNDRYGEYPSSAAIDPQGPATGSTRLLRGGGWGNYAAESRSGFRCHFEPEFLNTFTGFRLVRVPRPQAK